MASIYALNPRKARKSRKARSSKAVRSSRKVRKSSRSGRGMVVLAPKDAFPMRAYKSNPRRRRRLAKVQTVYRRARRNPRVGIVDMLLYGAGGAAGGVAIDFLTNLIPLPSSLSTGLGLTGTKVGLGIGAGYIVEKIWKRDAAGYIASGILAVIFHEAFGSTISGLLSSSTASAATTTSGTTTTTGTAGLGILNPSPIVGTAGLGFMEPVPTA